MTKNSVINTLKNRVSNSRKMNYLIASVDYAFHKNKETRLSFIFGCQRSGTTILRNTIGKDISTKAYGEGESPYFYPRYTTKRLRLKSKDEVSELLRYDRCKHALLKPLYESQWASRWLNDFPGSKAVWLYRNYIDVVDSHIKFYKNLNAAEYVKSALFSNTNYPWIHENIDPNILDRVKPLIQDKLTQADAYALYWYIRNTHYQEISSDPRVMIIKYEKLVLEREQELPRIFQFLGLPFKERYIADIRSNAINKNVSFDLQPAIRKLCEDMTDQLNSYT